MLFDNKNKHKISIPARDEKYAPVNVAYLVRHLCDKVMKDSRRELFVVDNAVYVSPSYAVTRLTADLSADGLVYWF